MADSVLEPYIATIDPSSAQKVRELDRIIMASSPELVSKPWYHMLAYAVKGDFRHWVCAIDPGRVPREGVDRKGRPLPKKPIYLRFLYGVLLDDPGGVLRAGTSILMTLDIASLADINPQQVTYFVKDAVSRLDEFKIREKDLKRK